jgi:hypothetical protein
MKLVRIRNNVAPKIILDGTEKEIIEKVHELDLESYGYSMFFERGKLENLGLGKSVYDYYLICEEENYKTILEDYKQSLITPEDILEEYYQKRMRIQLHYNDGSVDKRLKTLGKKIIKKFKDKFGYF